MNQEEYLTISTGWFSSTREALKEAFRELGEDYIGTENHWVNGTQIGWDDNYSNNL